MPLTLAATNIKSKFYDFALVCGDAQPMRIIGNDNKLEAIASNDKWKFRYRFHKFNFIDRKLLFTCKLVAITLLEPAIKHSLEPNGFTITGNSKASNSICGERDTEKKML